MNLVRYINSRKYKNSKLLYYIRGFIGYYIPKIVFRKRLPIEFRNYNKRKDYIIERVNYYNKLKTHQTFKRMNSIRDFQLPKKRKNEYSNRVYFFDTYQYVRYFDPSLKFATLFGDITTVPAIPSIVKSRPIEGDNANSVILNLNKVRHFMFVKDKKSFTQKKNMLVGRAHVTQPHRIKFMEMYFGHPMCDLGQTNKRRTSHPEWIVKPITINEHLEYKFILCLEGNDVATNLKWVMSSNSLAVMPRPKYETWFMEGTLIPDFHYMEIKSDYSDLEEKMNYYISHPEEALKIIHNAHEYIMQFKNKKRERIISLLVLQKYFECTN